jgi:hypothetical protein
LLSMRGRTLERQQTRKNTAEALWLTANPNPSNTVLMAAGSMMLDIKCSNMKMNFKCIVIIVYGVLTDSGVFADAGNGLKHEWNIHII